MVPFWLGYPSCCKLTAAVGELLLLEKVELKSGTVGAQRLCCTGLEFEFTQTNPSKLARPIILVRVRHRQAIDADRVLLQLNIEQRSWSGPSHVWLKYTGSLLRAVVKLLLTSFC